MEQRLSRITRRYSVQSSHRKISGGRKDSRQSEPDQLDIFVCVLWHLYKMDPTIFMQVGGKNLSSMSENR